LRLRLTPERSPIWIAHIPPYTTQDLDRLLADVAGSPLVTKRVIGKTPEGRDLLLLTVNDVRRPDEGKRSIWLMFRQHSWEAGSSWVGEGAIRALTSGRPGIGRLLRTATFKILPMCDPDGVARGGVRFNANGYDLNRNWDNVIPKLMPEIAAEKKAIYDWLDAGHTIEFFLTVHNTETAEYIDGPPFPTDPQMPELTTRFFHMLRDFTDFAPTRPPRESATTTVPGRRGSMTVVQALAQERNIPAYLMELAIARNPKLRRFPTIEDRLKFGAQLVYTLGRSVRPPRK